jgi:hypothetical protein
MFFTCKLIIYKFSYNFINIDILTNINKFNGFFINVYNGSKLMVFDGLPNVNEIV